MERDMFPVLTSMETENCRDSDSAMCVDEENRSQKASRVQFKDYLNMVLIPSRHEYKDAKCDLWWVSRDFQYFRTTAENEIRLLAMIKKISFREAKSKLFQPESLCDMDAHDYSFISQCDPESTEYFVQAFESSGGVTSVPSSSGAVSGSGVSGNEGTAANNISTAFPTNFSPAIIQYPRSRTSSRDDPSLQDYSHLHFCVPITNQQIPLRYDIAADRNLSANSKINSTLSTTVESLGETGFFAMMGLFSFAAPLLGYYFLSHH